MTLTSVTEKVGPISERLYEGAGTAGRAVQAGARYAYRAALNHPKTSIGGIVLAAALVGGLLWYVFGREEPAPRTRSAARVRAGRRGAPRARAARS